MSTFESLIQRRKFGNDVVAPPAWKPCSAKDDIFLTVGTTLLMLAPVLIVAIFAAF